MSRIKKIYLDMDGVLADFVQGVWDLCGIGTDDDDAMWAALKEVDNFYNKLEPMDGALEMVEALIAKYGDKCEILSAAPKPDRQIPEAEQDKRDWVKKYIGDIKANIVHAKVDKIPYCTGPDCILIDDTKENIDNWEAAGGTGILFTEAKSAYERVLEIDR